MKGFAVALSVGLAAATQVPKITLENIKRVTVGADEKDVEKRTLYGPFMGVNFPDPSIIWGDGSWKAFATSSNGQNVPVATSSDGVDGWTLTGTDALPTVGAWADASGGIWAPDVQKNDAGTYVMYYVAQKTGSTHCIGAATSSTCEGPYTPQSTPLICDDSNGGVIDPSGYDDGTNRWILWKVDGNSLGGATTCQGGTATGTYYYPTPIKIQMMARDALTLEGSASTILDNLGSSNDGVTEAPALYKIADDNYVLFYSAHCYSSDDYDIEYAFSSTIDGSYTNRGILIRTASDLGIYGPGSMDLDPNGTNMLFHGRLAANEGGSGTRELYSATISISTSDTVSGMNW